MNRTRTYLTYLLYTCLIGAVVFGCESWDLPSRKTRRVCATPAGTLTTNVQQRKVDLTITNSSGQIDRVEWDFGNGSTTVTTGMTVSYTYPAANRYQVRATLTNLCETKTVLTASIQVTDATPPTVSLQAPAVTDVFSTSATLRMAVTATGNADITRYGLCYSSTNQMPTVGDPNSQTTGQDGTLALNSPAIVTMRNLQPNTPYYVRSFAINASLPTTPGYSPVTVVSTAQNASVVSNGTPTTGTTTASVNFGLTSPGSPAAVEYGILYSATANTPVVGNAMTATVTNPAVGTNTPVNLTNLQPNTTYYYRPYAKAPSGEITYGPVQSFKTNPNTVTQDLIASVSFTNGSLSDVSGFNNNVNLVSNPTFTTDRKGQANAAILLDGTDDYFYMNDSPSLNPSSYSVSIWLKFDGIKNVNNRVQVYNKSRFTTSENEEYSSLIKINEAGPGYTFMANVKQGGNCVVSKGWEDTQFSTSLDLSQWHHLVSTYSGRTIQIYLDGNLISTNSNLSVGGIDYCPGGELKFGAQIQTFPNFYRGAMDDIRIFRRALTADEIKILYNE